MTVTASRPVKQPTPKTPPPGPATRAYRVLRKAWRRLTSMRTALILLFLLAVAAVPGSLLPQRALNPTKVSKYYSDHKTLAPVLSRFGFFDVFGSPWFAAIYLLLAVSLVGCLIPRIRLHYKAVRTKPLPAPRNLSRLPESATLTIDGDISAEQVAKALGPRWRRIVRTDDKTGAPTVSAEKGYSRETGNLLFHVSLLAALFAIAIGRLWGYSGSVVVVQGTGFCNVVQQFDSWRPGRFHEDGNIAPFCIDSLNKFTANYLPTGEPSTFAADVTYSEGANGTPRPDRIEVNHPLRIEGDRIYLIGHGFAPRVTVRLPDGENVTSTMAFIPTDPTTFLSEGAFKFAGPEAKNGGHSQDIGLDGFFAPTPQETAKGVYTSIAPQARNPVLGLFVYRGDLGLTGGPQSVYSLDQNQINSGKLKRIGRVNLTQGQTKSFAGGVTVTFDGWLPWASMQVSHDPAQGYLLVAAVGMVVGLIGSLGVRRRRVWVRLAPAASATPSGTTSATPSGTQSATEVGPADDGPGAARTVIVVGGLARSDAGDFHGEFGELVKRLESGLTADRTTTRSTTSKAGE
jgi:cytochrome c biogenesis protein